MAEWLSWDVLGNVADIASLATLPVSAYAALKVRALKRQLVSNALLDPLLAKIAGVLADPSLRSVRSVAALLYRQEKSVPRDIRDRIGRLRNLDQGVEDSHSGDPAQVGDEMRPGLVNAMVDELEIIAGLLHDTLRRRQVGGDDA